MTSRIKEDMHIRDVVRYLTANIGSKCRHHTWKKDYYVFVTESGNILYHTPEGNYIFDFKKRSHPLKGWQVISD